MYPDISTEPWDEYRARSRSAGLDRRRPRLQLARWDGYLGGLRGFTQIAEAIEGDITTESFYEAANTPRALDLNGMVPVLDFTKEWTDGLEGYNRLFNRSVILSEFDNGKVVPLTTEFEDVGGSALPPG